MTRFEKMDWLEETTTEEFFNSIIKAEMVRWMGENDFADFYEHLCGCWDIKQPEELAALMDE